MGRRSLAAERTDEILDAVESCIVQYGYPATSISRIATVAGMSPGHVTHYLPTKDAILTAMIERLLARLKATLSPLRSVPPDQRLQLALDRAFSDTDRSLIRLMDELIAISFTDNEIRAAVASLYRDFQRWWDDVIDAAYPDAPESGRRDVARALVWLGHGARLPVTLGMDAGEMARMRRMAETLVGTLT